MYLYITKSLIMAYNANGINVVDLTKYTIPARVWIHKEQQIMFQCFYLKVTLCNCDTVA